MRNLLVVVVVMLLVSLAVDLGGLGSRAEIEWQLFNPKLEDLSSSPSPKPELHILSSPEVALTKESGRSLVGLIRSHGMVSTLRLQITFTGASAQVLTTTGREETLTSASPNCTAQPSETVSCGLLMRVSDAKNASFIIAPDNDDLLIQSVSMETAQVKRATLLSGDLIYSVFLGLIILGPLLVACRRIKGLEGLVIAGISIGWMLFLSFQAFLGVLIFLGCVYFSLRWMIRQRQRSRSLLLVYLVLLVIVLFFVKLALPFLGYLFANPGAMWFALPLGLSYFIIKIVDILIAVHSRTIKELHAFEFFVFMVFPATLAAGPILTLDQFRTARITIYTVIDWTAGMGRFLLGAAKKVIADTFFYPPLLVATGQFILAPEASSSVDVCSFLLLTTLYVYLDFSAYSDMAIGAGRSMGWRIPENFDLPLLRQNMHQFWRAWHMTLSNWVFRRVFVTAVMGSRSRSLATFVSMLTIGLWHQIGLAWTFWAAHHSLMLIMQDQLSRCLDLALRTFRSHFMLSVGKSLHGVFGVCLVWIWVSLGHSFTQFSDWSLSIWAYFHGLQGAGVVALGFICVISLLWFGDWIIRTVRRIKPT